MWCCRDVELLADQLLFLCFDNQSAETPSPVKFKCIQRAFAQFTSKSHANDNMPVLPTQVKWVAPVVQLSKGSYEAVLVHAEPWSENAYLVEPGRTTMWVVVDKTGVIPTHAAACLETFEKIYPAQVRDDRFVVLCCPVP